jgi:hypothetical protein
MQYGLLALLLKPPEKILQIFKIAWLRRRATGVLQPQWASLTKDCRQHFLTRGRQGHPDRGHRRLLSRHWRLDNGHPTLLS